MTRTNPQIIQETILHLDKALEYGRLDTSEDHVIDAIALRISAAIDALDRLPSKMLHDTFANDWPAMKSMRNRIAHGYLTVKPDVLRLTLEKELPGLRERSTALLPRA